VEGAELVFHMVLGVMDELNLGGFKNMTSMKALNDMRDTINTTMPESFKEVGIAWPIIYGPIDKIDSNTYSAQLKTICGDKSTAAIKAIQDGWKNGTIAKLPSGAAEADYVKYFSDNLKIDQYVTEAELEICTKAGGVMKPHPLTKNLHCTWETATPSTCMAPWPQTKKPDGTKSKYYELDKKNKICAIAPTMMREKCESLSLGVTYNLETGSCNLTQAYCGRYGADGGLKNGDCAVSKGEQIAEMIFGTAFVRGIVNVFSMKNYEACPPGSLDINGITSFGSKDLADAKKKFIGDTLGQQGAYDLAGGYLCFSDHCSDKQEQMGGLCYPKCKKATDDEKKSGWNDFNSRAADTAGGENVKVSGMCYRCPPGYYKSAPGTCQRTLKTDPHGQLAKCPPGFTDTGLFCNVKTYSVGVGTPKVCQKTGRGLCHTKRPWHCSGGEREEINGLCYKKCKPGDIHVPGMPYNCRKAGGLLVQQKIKMGVCPSDKEKEPHGAMCYKKCSDYGPGWKRTVGPTCAAPQYGGSDVIPTAGNDKFSYSRNPDGPSVRIFPKKRAAPFPSTSENDFKNSSLGRQIQGGINGIRNGDMAAIGKSAAGIAVLTNPAVLALGVGDLGEMGLEKAGLGPKEKRQQGYGGED
jgi:hypothetical protein